MADNNGRVGEGTQQVSHTPLSGQTSQTARTIGAGKEGEPLGRGTAVEIAPIREKPMSPEVAKYIQKQDPTVELDEVLRQAGLTKGQDEELTVPDGPHLLLDDSQIVYGLKQPVNSSLRWLATLMLYLLEQSHYTIRTVKGQVQRVFKP